MQKQVCIPIITHVLNMNHLILQTFTPKNDWLLNSPHNITLGSNIKIMRIKEMIPNLEVPDGQLETIKIHFNTSLQAHNWKIKYLHTFSDLPSNLLKSWNNGTWYKRKEKLVASKPEVPSTLKNHCIKLKPVKIVLFFLNLAFFASQQKINKTQCNFFQRKIHYFAFQTIFTYISLHDYSLSTNLGTTGT